MTAKVPTPDQSGLPAYVRIGYTGGNQAYRNCPYSAAYLGGRYDPFVILDRRTGTGKNPERDRDFRVRQFDAAAGVTPGGMLNRQQLLAHLDRMRYDADQTDVIETIDQFHQRAFDMLTSVHEGPLIWRKRTAVRTSDTVPVVLVRRHCWPDDWSRRV